MNKKRVSQKVSQKRGAGPPGGLYRHSKTGGWYWRVAARHVPENLRGKGKYSSISLVPVGRRGATKSRSVAEAVRKMLWTRWHKSTGDETVPAMGKLLENFRQWNLQNAGPTAVQYNQSAVRRFLGWAGINNPLAITPRVVQDYMIHLREQSRAPRTQKKHKCSISRFCRFLIVSEILDVNPATAAMTEKPQDPPPRYLTRRQIRVLLRTAEVAAPELYLPILFCLRTGARVGEMMRMTWRDWDERVIRATKTKNYRAINWPMGLRRRIEAMARRSDYIFPQWHRRTWGRAMSQLTAGLPIFGELPGSRTGNQWHLLRATWAVNFARSGATLWQLMSSGGWSDTATPMRYINLAQAAGTTDLPPGG